MSRIKPPGLILTFFTAVGDRDRQPGGPAIVKVWISHAVDE